MSNNLYNDFPSSFTFHGNAAPPPLFTVPPPCPIYIPPPPPPTSDQDFVKSFESYITKSNVENPKTDSISTVRGKITNLIKSLDEIKEVESKLRENIRTMSDTDWDSHMKDIEDKKANIIRILNIGDLDNVRKLLAKRAAKRLRMKRVKLERSRAKKERVKQMEERSRKIDENLKKIQDDIEKSKQETEAKLHTDSVLKEVMRKKTDAKKSIGKLDALLRLRRARANTVKGRGETVAENETVTFEEHIEKIKQLWCKKLEMYEKEEKELRVTLKESSDVKENVSETDSKVLENLKNWREVLFGDCLPQVNFKGDANKFVSIRCEWDKLVCSGGSALPLGWVLPHMQR
ncbi:PREDICTED: programmed cell death protein 7-like [Papilio polytes]|uniref:programmed cell death protein 7-like n=1 Tax=Papilio polytes TaxID=76194 RepID=UPI000675F780|nr:PREDICTED: programmed cell death protein 7-like [Papilio polytes]